MKELIDAAKAVIGEFGYLKLTRIEKLRAAVDRAESDDEIDRINREAMNIYLSGVMAERERIRGEIQELKANCSDDGAWRECCDEILGMIDDVS